MRFPRPFPVKRPGRSGPLSVAERSLPVPDSERTVEQRAADWLILLREAPENVALRDRFEAWLDLDPAHVCAWVAVSETFAVMAEIGPNLEGRWEADRLAPSRPARRGWRFRSIGHGGPVRPGGIVAGAIAASLALWLAPVALLHVQSDYVTAPGELRSVALADGSTVQMGPGSALAVDYRADARSVRLLAGEAWFDVEHNPAAPFRVRAGKVQTTVLGTSFDVRLVGSATAVSLKRGRVRVAVEGEGAAHELSPGQWVRIGEAHTIENGASDPALLGLWREGAIIAHDRPIEDVIDELRPWFRGRIVLLNRALGKGRVDGVYNARDPENALAAIVERAGGKVRPITPWLIVIS